jgi:hypothetical protein
MRARFAPGGISITALLDVSIFLPQPVDCANHQLAVVLGLALTGAVTQFTKLTVGRPRPGKMKPSLLLTRV